MTQRFSNKEYVIDFTFLVSALERQKQGFEELTNEWEQFIPRPLSPEQLEQIQEMKEHLYSLNPDQPKAPLDKIVENQFDPKWQGTHLYNDKFNDYCMLIVLLSSAVIEAYINNYIAIKVITAKLN